MPRVVRERFWDLVRSGVAPGDAGVAAGSADGARRWFRVAGGVKGNGPGAVSGRYLSLADREEIAVGAGAGGVVPADRGAAEPAAAGVDGEPGGGAERAGRAVPGGAGAGAGGAAGAAAQGG